jgi:hypothetical protein
MIELREAFPEHAKKSYNELRVVAASRSGIGDQPEPSTDKELDDKKKEPFVFGIGTNKRLSR